MGSAAGARGHTEEHGTFEDSSTSAQQQVSGSTQAQACVLRSVPFLMAKQGLGCLVCAAHITPPRSPNPDVSMLEPQSSVAGTLCPTKQAAKCGQAPRFLPCCWRRSRVLAPDHRGLQGFGHCRSLLPQMRRGQCHLLEKYTFIYHLCFAQETRRPAEAMPPMVASTPRPAACREWQDQVSMGDPDVSKGQEGGWRCCFNLGPLCSPPLCCSGRVSRASPPAPPPQHGHGFSPGPGPPSGHRCFWHIPCKAVRMS